MTPSQPVKDFVKQPKPAFDGGGTAVSLFSGAGISDLGYQMAGFQFLVQVELDGRRAAIGSDNFSKSKWIVADARASAEKIAEAYRESAARRLDLLTATPPCQGMSTSNPSRGKRHASQTREIVEKNRLVLEVIPIANLLKPRIIVVENVRQMLTLEVKRGNGRRKALDVLRDELPEYEVFAKIINAADYGVPQVRKRAVVVAVHKDEPRLRRMFPNGAAPLPNPTHREKPVDGESPWATIEQWFNDMDYQPLDSRSKEAASGTHPLHFVPAYGPDRYRQISEIPPYSGRSAYENAVCPTCGYRTVDAGLINCSECGGVMRNRPHVERNGRPRLINGFRSSYRRMRPDRPSYTITTNSSHIGSDFKIHPWEHRVLSVLECADLQTVPRFYDWSRAKDNGRTYLIRQLVGEAFPTYFTYLHGRLLYEILQPAGGVNGKRNEQASGHGGASDGVSGGAAFQD